MFIATKIWLNGQLAQEVLTHKVQQLFDHMVLQDHMIN